MKLKELRSRISLTQKSLAEKMGTTQQTVARWETGKTVLNVDQIRELCMILQCTADQLLGWSAEEREARTNPFSTIGSETPFGTLQVQMKAFERRYPIGEEARKSLLRQLDNRSPINTLNDDDECAWLQTWTLDNKLLLINPTSVWKLKLVSDDAVAMPNFENPEVYRALEDWPNIKVTGKARQACDDVVSSLEQPEDILRIVSQAGIYYQDGSEDWSYLTEELATEWYGIVISPPDAKRHSFLEVDREGHEEISFANLSTVSVVELPANLFLRLTTD